MRNRANSILRRLGVAGAVVGLTTAGLIAPTGPASADSAPPTAGVPETVTADVLPTVQHNGVAWDQVTVGNKVFVVGSFTSARPAGSAVGVNEVPRSNILAFDITTGALDTSFAPVLDGQALSIAVSPDQKTIYVGGDFQKVNGLWRVRVAAFDVATGALKPFAPVLSSTVRTVEASSTTVYVGGDFNAAAEKAGGTLVPRRFLAAFDAQSGALKPFDPSPDASVTALTLNYARTKLVVAGRFLTVAGQSWYGMAALDPTTGAATPWAATTLIRNAGTKAALSSLTATPDGVLGTGYVFGTGGNLEGAFRADNETGQVVWIDDCHGDHYSAFQQGSVVYTASHAHYCGNFGGFPQTNPWTSYHSGAVTLDARTTITADPYGYFNWEGNPAPQLLNWFPTWLTGTYTTSKQAAWSITGNGSYLVYGGEFIGVNGAPQQGLVRFAKKTIAPNKVRPNLNDGLTPALVSATSGEVRVGWQATHDRDNEAITYRVFRDFTSLSNTPVYQVTVNSLFWKRPDISFVDRNVTPGRTYEYRVYAYDPFGNRAEGAPATITVATASTEDAYLKTVLSDAPNHLFRFEEGAGSATIKDAAGSDNARAGASVTLGGAGVRGRAVSFNGTAQDTATQVSQAGPDTFSVEAWFRTTSTVGGQVVGYGTNAIGSSTWGDRMVYLDGSGRVTFGVYQGSVKTLTSGPGFNDGSWHHVVGTVGPQGLRLYVDAKLIGIRGDATAGRYYSGVWRLGGDVLSTSWPNRPTNGYFTGSVDEVAVYGSQLTSARVAAHYVAGGGSVSSPPAPTDAYGRAVVGHDPELYWRLNESSGSTAADTGLTGNTGSTSPTLGWGAPGALAGVSGTAARFDGSKDVVVSARQVVGGPASFTAGVWFRTATTRGGKLIGFGSASSGLSATSDRHLYLRDDGRLVFGTGTTAPVRVTSPAAYNDDAWHFAVATQSSAGMRLYVDGALVGSDPQASAPSYYGYWRIGGDVTGGSTSNYLAGILDEAMVLSRPLTNSEVAALHALGAPNAPNQSPVAAFTAATSALTATLDASGSTDPDGTISTYAWNFGDGTTGTGRTTSHAYAAAGTYQVTLTVTDDDGATDTESKAVTVTEAPNQAPTAEFTVTPSALTVAVDGSASSDPDGSIASYAWTFGDGSTGTGRTASHDYAAPGTYTITLRVTDNRGGTASTTRSVTVTAQLARDEFARTVASGWGTAPLGGAWTACGGTCNSSLSVASGTGRMTLAAGRGVEAYLASTATDIDARVDLSVDRVPTGGGSYASLVARGAYRDGYRGKARFMPDGSVQLSITRSSAAVETTLASTSLPAGTYTVGAALRLRMQVVGTSPTTLRLRAWIAGSAEPASWTLSTTDSTAALQVPGTVGVWTYLSGSATNGPTVFGVDNLSADRIAG